MYRSGYPLAAVNQVDVQMTSKASSPGHKGSPLPSGSSLCEDGRPYITDPVTGRQICVCNLGADAHYVSRGLIPAEARKHGAIPGAPGPPSLGFDASAFYSPLIRSLPLRQERLPPYLSSGVPGQPMPFDPALAGHPYGLLYAGMDMNGGAMRKAATRETTGPLKAWLSEHKKNPYPTKAEKIMLAIITRMTLTQVSTWFANARRRLKKENKLYPPDKEGREDDDDDDYDDTDSRREGNSSRSIGSDKRVLSDSDNEDINVDLSDTSDVDDEIMASSDDIRSQRERIGLDLVNMAHETMTTRIRESKDHCFSHSYGKESGQNSSRLYHHQHQINDHKSHLAPVSYSMSMAKTSPSSTAQTRPKIWSISEIISGPSTPSDISRYSCKVPQISPTQTSPHQGTSKSLFPASATPTRHTPPSSTSVISSSLSLTPFSTSPSSSSSPLSPPAFRPSSLLMSAPNLFSHRPEFSAFVCKSGLSMPTSCLNFNSESNTDSPIDLQKVDPVRSEDHDDGGENYQTNLSNNRGSHISTIQPIQESGGKLNTSDPTLNLTASEKKHYPDLDLDSKYRNEPRARSLGHSSDSPFSGSPRKAYKHEVSSTISKTVASKMDSPHKPMTQNSTQQDKPKIQTAHLPQNVNVNGHLGNEEALDLQTTKRFTDS